MSNTKYNIKKEGNKWIVESDCGSWRTEHTRKLYAERELRSIRCIQEYQQSVKEGTEGEYPDPS